MRAVLSSLAVAALAGCNWISVADLDARRPNMDDDGDGYPSSDDCDDASADINPGKDEVWYDGIDSDCAKDDDFDADQDGYVVSEYAGQATAGVDGTGQLPGGDCDDSPESGALINPSVTDDSWYDGVDTDCDGTDDYDQDGDGYVEDAYVGAATTYVDGTGSLPGGDCDDTRSSVHPDAVDAWYDGVDTDCDGRDDYDQDEDAYVPAEYDGLETEYVDPEVSPLLPSGDCDDQDASIGPAMAEVWYDGIDQDCDETTTDTDQDGDGFDAEVVGGTDCADTDESSYPGATENLSDATDHDCDGGSTTFIMSDLADYSTQSTSLSWERPHDLRFTQNSSTVFLSVATDAAVHVKPGSSGDITVNYFDSALAFGFTQVDLVGGYGELIAWYQNVTADPPSYSLSDGHDLIATDDRLVGGLSFELPTGRALRVASYDLTTGARTGHQYQLNDGSGPVLAPIEDISVELDGDGNFHAVGCEADTAVMQYITGDPANLSLSADQNYDARGEYEAMPGLSCELHFYAQDNLGNEIGTLLMADPTVSSEYTFETDPADDVFTVEATAPTTGSPRELEILRDADDAWLVFPDTPNSSIVFVDSAGVESSYSTSSPPVSVQAMIDESSDDILFAYADQAGDAWMVWGTPDTGWTSVGIDVDFAAEEAAAWVNSSGGTILIAVLGTDDLAFGRVQR